MHVLPQRPRWYTCACCPPNVVRLLMSLGKYFWTETEKGVYSHMFAAQEASFEKMDVTVTSQYPWKGEVTYEIHGKTEEKTIFGIHLPGWVDKRSLRLTCCGQEICVEEICKDGYLEFRRRWGERDVITLEFSIPVRRIYANHIQTDNLFLLTLYSPDYFT